MCRTCRNEVTDRSLFWNTDDLQRKLDNFKVYFNENRAHMGIDMITPNSIYENKNSKVININNYRMVIMSYISKFGRKM